VVTEADSGRAALTILERDTPCDLMVADLVMPGLSGLDTLRLARRTRPDLKVLFASGYADLSRFGDNLGGHSLLKKPFKPETLAEAVQTALQRVSAGEPDNIVPLRRDQK
jgi:two-component system cell cycle sensor histidine kinase/response regulator CckA